MDLAKSLEAHELSSDHCVYRGKLPDSLSTVGLFPQLWSLKPDTRSFVKMPSGPVAVPRYDKAFGEDYAFRGQMALADPIPAALQPFLDWVRETVEPTANGIFMNWHEASEGHYHGKHRDSVKGLIQGTPITTISFGEARIFRVRQWKGDKKARFDFNFHDRDVIVIPWETNLNWTHEIPKLKSNVGRRISITIRSFN